MRVLLDSNAYSNLKRGHPRVVELIRGSEEIYLSTIVIGELLFGFRMGSRFDRNVRELHAFLDNPYVTLVPVSLNTADRYSRIAASLRRTSLTQERAIWAILPPFWPKITRKLLILGRRS